MALRFSVPLRDCRKKLKLKSPLFVKHRQFDLTVLNIQKSCRKYCLWWLFDSCVPRLIRSNKKEQGRCGT